MSNDVVPASEQRLLEFMTAAQNQAPVDPQQAQLDIIRRILAGNSAADVLEQTSALHAADVLGDVLQIIGFTFNESTFDGKGPQFYMLIECVDADGEPFKVTCGAVNVMAQLFRLGQLDALPLKARITENEHATAAGYKPMWLTAVAPGDESPVSAGAKAEPF